jgi:hypothetical protein
MPQIHANSMKRSQGSTNLFTYQNSNCCNLLYMPLGHNLFVSMPFQYFVLVIQVSIFSASETRHPAGSSSSGI